MESRTKLFSWTRSLSGGGVGGQRYILLCRGDLGDFGSRRIGDRWRSLDLREVDDRLDSLLADLSPRALSPLSLIVYARMRKNGTKNNRPFRIWQCYPESGVKSGFEWVPTIRQMELGCLLSGPTYPLRLCPRWRNLYCSHSRIQDKQYRPSQYGYRLPSRTRDYRTPVEWLVG